MVLLLVFHISLHIEPSSLLVEERKVIKSLFMVHLVVLVLHVGMQIAKFLEMDVYGTASTEAGLSLIKDHNCHPFNHREEGYLDKLNENKDSFH